MVIFIVWKALSSIQDISKQYLQLYFDQKQRKLRFQIFNLNHGLTPLEKSLIRRLRKIDIFRVWKAFPSIQNIVKQCFQLYFDQKQRKTKFEFFDLNLRLTPEEDRIVSHDAFFQKHHAITQSQQIPSCNKIVSSSAFFSLDFQ